MVGPARALEGSPGRRVSFDRSGEFSPDRGSRSHINRPETSLTSTGGSKATDQQWRMSFQEASQHRAGTPVPPTSDAWWRGEPTIASPKAAQSGYLGTRYSSGQVDDTPLCMESPARRPLSKQQWGRLRKDSLRPGEEESHLGVKMQKMGWLWKAVGRPPHRTWVRKWVYLLDDKLCWVAEEDVESMKVTRTTGTASAPTSPVHPLTAYPPAMAGIGGSAPSSPHAGARTTSAPPTLTVTESMPQFSGVQVKYVPLDRIPVRGTPRGYAAGTAISKVSDTHVCLTGRMQGKSLVAFALVVGSHTHFFAANTSAEADAWITAIKQAWFHCAYHTSRASGFSGSAEQQEHLVAKIQGEKELLKVQVWELTESVANTDSAPPNRLHLPVKKLDNAAEELYERWVAQKAENLVLQSRLQATVLYEVRVCTGQQRGCGTNSRVYLELFGAHVDKRSGEHQLSHEDRATVFKRGSEEVFTITSVDLGALKALHLWQDNSGTSPGWFLESVHVRRQGGREGSESKWTDFPCQAWLSAHKGQRRLAMRLEAGKSAQKAISYQVTTKTSNLSGAGTDANVSLTLYFEGPGGSKPTLVLELSSGEDDFKRGEENTFVVRGGDFGRIAEAWIGHDNLEAGADWHLDHVEIQKLGQTGTKMGPALHFSANRWIVGPPNQPDAVNASNPIQLIAGGVVVDSVPWIMTVHTGDMKGAGTDATVRFSVEYIAQKGKSGAVTRTTSQQRLPSNPDFFERGKTDEFQILLPNAELQTLTIKHDNDGDDPAWYLDYIELKRKDSSDPPIFFPCFQWLRDSKGSSGFDHIEQTLKRSAENPATQVTQYWAETYTVGARGSGTDAQVYIQLHGSAGDSAKIKLNAEEASFSPGHRDKFSFSSRDLGTLERCTLFHDNTGDFPDWTVQKVELVCQTELEEVTTFWICRTIYGKDKSQHASVTANACRSADSRPKLYQLHVTTGSLKGAGTDANVFMTIKGDKGEAKDIVLATKADTFEAGSRDKFEEVLAYLGKISSITVWHDATSNKPTWYLQSVILQVEEFAEFKAGSTFVPEKYCFYFNDWLKKKEGDTDHPSTGLLLPQDEDMSSALIEACCEVVTSGLKGAGTDSEVRIRLHGRIDAAGGQRSSSWVPLTASHDTFERGRTDLFDKLQVEDVGQMASLEVELDPCTSEQRAAWKLDYIKVTLRRGKGPLEVAYFNGPLEFGPQPLEYSATLPTSPNKLLSDYTIEFWTSDVKHAGTDARVTVELKGVGRDMHGRESAAPVTSGKVEVPSSQEDFEVGGHDTMTLQLRQLGDIRELVLSHDGQHADARSKWHVFKVLVTDVSAKARYWFLVDQWVGPGSEITAQRQAMDPDTTMQTAIVTLTTLDEWDAETDCDIALSLHGATGTSGVKALGLQQIVRSGGSGAKLPCQRGSSDEYNVRVRDTGDLQFISIGLSDGRPSHSWGLASVSILFNGKTYLFVHNAFITGSALVKLYPAERDPASVQVQYTIRTLTGRQHVAASETSVSINLRSARAPPGNAQQQLLDTSHSASAVLGMTVRKDGAAPSATGAISLRFPVSGLQPFQRGQLDEFKVTAVEIGSIEQVVVGVAQDAAEWFLEWVEVHNARSNEVKRFYCKQWLSATRAADKHKIRTLSLQQDPEVEYHVVVKTADLRGAGTDADVFIEVFNTRGDSSGALELLLQPGDTRDPFERNQEDKFMVRGVGVGTPAKMSIWVKGSAAPVAWAVDWASLQISQDCKMQPQIYYANFNRQWLRRSSVTLKHPESSQSAYKVTVKTSDERGAGTDANVLITLHGDTSSTPVPLKSGSATLFERNVTDVFQIKIPDVGDLKAITVEHDGTGPGAGWKLDSVEIEHEASRKRYVFVCQRWLDCDKEDGKIKRRLSISTGRETPVRYSIKVHTSNERSCGTDADVYVILVGDKGETSPMQLVHGGNTNPFERGQVDEFEETGQDVGSLRRLRIGHGGKGQNPDWKLDKVEVRNLQTGQAATFVCNKWLSQTKDDRMIERELFVDSADAAASFVHWRAVVVTGSARGAGTDADVYLEILGDLKSEQVTLAAGKEAFERGRTDTFQLQTDQLGSHVSGVVLSVNNRGFSPDWQVASVLLQNNGTGQSWTFPAGDAWLNLETGWRLDLRPGSLPDAPSSNTARRSLEDGRANYKITTITGKEAGAGTDANVYIDVFGIRNGEVVSTGAQKLVSKTSTNLFEPGQSDDFELSNQADVGELTSVVVTMTGSMNIFKSDSWLLQSLIIQKQPPGKTWPFTCNQWLKKGQDNGQDFCLTLHVQQLGPGPGASPAQDPQPYKRPKPQGYSVQFKTANNCLAGTRSRVFFELFGSLNDSGTITPRADTLEANAFQRNATDRLTYTRIPFLGEVLKVHVGSDGMGGFPSTAWNLESVTVICHQTRTVFQFSCPHPISKKTNYEMFLERPHVSLLPY